MNFEPHVVSVTSVGVRQLCLRRIGVRSQKSLKTAGLVRCLELFICCSGLFGFISNSYVVTVIALYKPMHKQLTNIYITNQSVIDATVAMFLFFTTLFEDDKRTRTPGYGPDEAICRLWYTKVSACDKMPP